MRVYPRSDWPFKIIEEKAVTDALVSARAKYARFDDIWDGIVWLICHNGHKIGADERSFGGVGHYVYTFEGDPIAGFPRIVAVYKWGVGAFTLRMILVSSPEGESSAP